MTENEIPWPARETWPSLPLAQKLICLEAWLDDALSQEAYKSLLSDVSLTVASSTAPTDELGLQLEDSLTAQSLDFFDQTPWLTSSSVSDGLTDSNDTTPPPGTDDHLSLTQALPDVSASFVFPTSPSMSSLPRCWDRPARGVEDKRARNRAASLRFRRRDKERRDLLRKQLKAAMESQDKLSAALEGAQAKNRMLEQMVTIPGETSRSSCGVKDGTGSEGHKFSR